MAAGTATVLVVGAAALVYPGNVVWMALVGGVLVVLERSFALRPQRSLRRAWPTDVAHLVVNRAVSGVVLVAALASLVAVLRHVVFGSVPHAVGAQPAPLQFVEVLVLGELCAYWSHRAMHRIPFLWRLHRLHHSGSDLDWLIAYRRHPLEVIVGGTIGLLPILLPGFSAPVLAIVALLGSAQNIVVHANLRLRFGPLRYLVVTPEYHHWHHVREAEHRDSNYAFSFPLTDRLFGTMHLPRDRQPTRFGLASAVPDRYVEQLAWALAAPVADYDPRSLSRKKRPSERGLSHEDERVMFAPSPPLRDDVQTSA